MKSVYYFYTLVIFSTKIVWIVLSGTDFEEKELDYLSMKLNPVECLRLLEAMYSFKTTTNDNECHPRSPTTISFNDESLRPRDFEKSSSTPDNCRVKLEDWSRNLPGESSRWGRVAMENVLRTLGRQDLAKFVNRGGRLVRYINELPRRIYRDSARRSTLSKFTQVTAADRAYKNAKEVVIHVVRAPAEAKTTTGISISENREEIKGAHARLSKSDADDSTTRWTAFLILLGLIALTILATVIFALYKNNNGARFCDKKEKIFDDDPRPTLDVERGDIPPSYFHCGRTRRESSIPEQSPYSSPCVRVSSRKSKKKKYRQEKPKTIKRRRRRCDKSCTGIAKEEILPIVQKVEKATKTKERKTSEKGDQFTVPEKPRLDLKKFHEKIANILKKDNTSCKCCKCSVFPSEDNTVGKKDICADERCQKRRLQNITELCLPPTDAPEEDDAPRKFSEHETKKRHKTKHHRKKSKDNEKEREREKKDKEKESEKTSPENSARSKQARRESKSKAKKGKWNLDEACTKKTCHSRRRSTLIDEILDPRNNFR